MHDLSTLLSSEAFDNDPAAPTRVAMIHRSFRSVGMTRGLEESYFKAHFPALGLLNLAESIRNAGRDGTIPMPELRYFDEDSYLHETDFLEAIKTWLEPAARRVVAASTYTSTIDRLEASLGQFAPDRYLVMAGGAHASVAPDIDNVHLIVRGEGAAAILHTLRTFGTEDFFDTKGKLGLNYRVDGRQTFATPCFDRSLAEMPAPAFAYDLLPEEVTESPVYATSFTRMLGRSPQLYICTQSCRGRCTFCSTYLIHGRTVARPLELIRQDLAYLIEYQKCDSLEFHDDDLTQHAEFDELVEELGRLGLPWFCYLRVDGITEERAARMAAANCKRAFVGLESMNQETLDYFNKEVTVEQNRSAIRMLAGAGVDCITGFIIGAPAHTPELINADLQELLDLPLYAMNCTILSPDPATVEFVRAKKAEKYGEEVVRKDRMLRLIPDVQKYGRELPTGLPTVCDNLGKLDLNRLQAMVDARFYFRPEVLDRLLVGRDGAQRQVVLDYYAHIARRIDSIDMDGAAPEVAALVGDARRQVARFRTDRSPALVG